MISASRHIHLLTTTFTKQRCKFTHVYFSFFLSLNRVLNKLRPALESPKSYSSIKDLMYNSSWKWIGREDKREKGRCKGKERRRRKRQQVETENQKQGRQADRWSGWFEVCPMQSLWWTITAWSTAYAAGRHWIESENQSYQCGFHIADSVFINTLSFSIQLTVTEWNVIVIGSGSIEMHSLFDTHKSQPLSCGEYSLLTTDWKKTQIWNT